MTSVLLISLKLYFLSFGNFKNFPNVKLLSPVLIKNSEFNKSDYQEFEYIPFQHAHGILPKSEDCMIAKYNVLGAQLDYFYNGIKNIITRNTTKELELYNNIF